MRRPELTFPEPVADYVKESYEAARCILEYGSGGSTVLASELIGKKIYSVESDKAWSENLEKFIRESPLTKSFPEIVHVNIGPTKEWGHPVSDEGWREFHKYPIGLWQELHANGPDVILVDGRFRLACFLTCCLMTRRTVKILFDDYRDRTNYHSAETVSAPTLYIDRMAVFEISPGMIGPEHFPLLFRSLCSTA